MKTVFIRQQDPGLKKSWYQGQDCDLYVWVGAHNTIERFQLAVSLQGGEHLLEWTPRDGVRLGRVDPGEPGAPFKGTPVVRFLSGEPRALVEEARAWFLGSAEQVPGYARDFVLARLAEAVEPAGP
ncbi:MAG: hypothetical protein HY722_04020 [Planctomycetes bacterium]|nr:hypothetical protein [Planctomycetota bacterium]